MGARCRRYKETLLLFSRLTFMKERSLIATNRIMDGVS
jgi:hypothetical protein